MRDRVRSLRPWFLEAVAIVSLGVVCAGCSAKGSSYVGRWECSAGGRESFEIKANNGAFLVTDEKGITFPAALDDKGTLVLSGIPLLGSLPLPIDTANGELVCSACDCHRLTLKRTADAGAPVARAVAAYFRPRSNDGGDSGAQRRTVADMRNVGTAMFSWLTDQVGAAAAGQKTVDLTAIPTTSFAALKELLVPQYIQTLPERDGWGNLFEYRLNVKNPSAKSTMSIRSPGRDGKFSGSTYVVGGFPRADYDRDIVWADGYFVQAPQ